MKSQSATQTIHVDSQQSINRWIALFIGLSGMLALVYEVIWQRQFALIFGSSAPATAAVLSVYFAGLGLGAWCVGRRASTWSHPLRAYALLELSIGVGAVLVTPLTHVFDIIYPTLFHLLANRAGSLLLFKSLAAGCALLIPTFCMGGTLPLLGPFVDRGQNQLGRTAGWLYFVNTMGAAVGALAVPLFLLPRFGLLHSVWGCASINGSLALGAWLLDTRGKRIEATTKPLTRTEKKGRQEKSSETDSAQLGSLAFISGFVTFALQILWNRAFAQLHENSMYSFAVVVAVTIAALAIGSQFARLGLKRNFAPLRFLSATWIVGGAVIAISPWAFIQFSDHLAYLSGGASWYAEAGRLVALAAALLFVPMALVGVGFPILMQLAGQNSAEEPGRALGRLFSVNVIGSIAGSLVAGFIFPSWLGLWNSIICLGLILVAVGVLARSQSRRRSLYSFSPYAASLAVTAGVGAASFLSLPRVSIDSLADEKLVALTEGPHGIVAVVERPGSRRLKLNNHYGLGGTASTGDERMQAHIPLLLHPAPHRVAFLGLGTGITAGGALFHPVDQITIIELVPEVVTSARKYFRDANRAVLDDPRTELIADDARHALRSSGAHYDVIVGDLVVPWRQGEGSLFTFEQFQAARNALLPKGIFCQWLPLFQLSAREVNIISRTFLQVFPHAQVWRGDFSPTEPAIALVASNETFSLDASAVRRRMSEMRLDSANSQLRAEENFWMNYIGELDASRLDTTEQRLNLDDRPWVEILGPLLHAGGDDSNLFTGRPLQSWERTINARSREQMALLPKEEISAVHAGDALAEMTLCSLEHNTPGEQAAQAKLRTLLPEAAFRELF